MSHRNIRIHRILLVMILLMSVLSMLGCAAEEPVSTGEQQDDATDATETADGSTEPAEEPTTPSWAEIELTDVQTGETFTIAEQDSPVLIQAFAVW